MESSIHKKLHDVQQRLKAPKGQYNSFAKFNYRSCEDILEAVKPLLSETNLVLTIQDEVVNLGDRYYIKATTTIYDADNNSVSTSALAREPEIKTGMDLPQITGTASSYARKYALNGLFAIDDQKDADSNEYKKQTTSKKPSLPPTVKTSGSKITTPQIGLIRKLASDAGIDMGELKKKYEVESTKDLSMTQASEIINKLKTVPKDTKSLTLEDLGWN